MVRRTILISLIAGMFAVVGGCCAFDASVCEPGGGCNGTCYEPPCRPNLGLPWRAGCGMRCQTACESACETECGPSCGPSCGSSCGSVCESCESCEDPCGGSCGRPRRYRGGPLGWLYKLAHPIYWQGGCGEMYWGDFHGERPDCCDTCNRMGQWTGSRGVCSTQSDRGGFSEPAKCETCGRPYSSSDQVVVVGQESNLPTATHRMDRGARLVSQTEEIVEPVRKSTWTKSTCRNGHCPNQYRQPNR